MADHWKANGPPVYIAVAAYLGLAKPEASATKEVGNLEDLERMFMGSGGMIQ